MNKKDLKQNLTAKFDISAWKSMLDEIFFASSIEYFSHEVSIEAKLIKSGGQIGNIRLNDGRSLAIFKFEVADNINISRNRKGLRDIAAKYVDQSLIHGALVFFYSEEQIDYRLTFIAKQTSFNDEGQLVKTETAPKRYTFLLGANEPCTTATNRLYELYERSRKNGSVYLADVTEAFSVERLNKDFFDGYKKQYKKFLDTLSDTKQHRDYVKKLLGRIVFLHFLQKKGWMGIPVTNKNWDGGDKNYLANLVNKYNSNPCQLSKVLNILFFETLNKPRTDDLADSILGDNIKIPYLNGGLFDKDNLDKLDIDFPYDYFKDLMDFFSQYNFTIDENDPNDAEVGIDPEMLGHIFENLLEDNKDKGAFYTPKEIVQYMCRQSIIQYLKTHESDTHYADPIERLINEGIVMPILQGKDVANRFVQLLKNVKVCDPAIGSGAFPMGILYVLYHTIHHLHSHAEPNSSFDSIKTKRDIIQNNIYGVDIEKGAVDIARLRFWLALVVDEEEKPKSLPNLDYKIMQGDSLLEGFMGYDLSRILPVNQNGKISKHATRTVSANDMQGLLVFGEEKESINEIQRLIRLYFSPENQGQKESLRKDIEARVKEHIVICSGNAPSVIEAVERIDNDNKPFFLWHLFFANVFQEGGFDIVIGNPPYIKEGRMSKLYFHPYKSSPYYKGKMDIWYMFGCKGLDLLNKNGILCFIATNNWVTSFGAGILRNKVMRETRICNLVDFGAVMMFDSASIQTMIMMFQKDSKTNDYTFDYRKLTKYKATEKDAIAMLTKSSKDADCFYPTIRRGNYIDKNFTFSRSSDVLERIKQHNNAIFLTSKEIAQGIVFPQDTLNRKNQSILGNNFKEGEGIFVLSQCEKDALQLNIKELSLVKPYYTSDNVNRYFIFPNNSLWTIYTDSSYKNSNSLDEYPHIKAHLDKYVSIFTSDNKPYGLHRAREERFFIGNKILVMRKSVDHPIFSYCDFPCYVSQTFNMIQTDRVCMKYLTGLLNSTLIEFWLKNKGKMQGANYQLDKEPLQEIPIVVPAADVQNLIATLVDAIILLRSNPTERASSLVSNKYLASEYEKLIDGCIYELYLSQEMEDVGISVIPTLSKYMQSQEFNAKNMPNIWNVYKMVDDNGLINSIDSLPLLDSEMLKTIILS